MTGDKRSRTSRQGIEDSPGSHKRRKIDNFEWSDEKVGIKILDVRTGVAEAKLFERKQGNGQNIEEIKQALKETDDRKIHTERVYFYEGFKAALENLLTETMGRTHESQDIILIHGIPEVGKTTLATCLAYHLALTGNPAVCVRMDYKADLKIETATRNLSSYFVKDRWVILDQVNTNCIDINKLTNMLPNGKRSEDDPQMPIVIFTSGHYPPENAWTESESVLYKVINLNVDEKTVDTLLKRKNIPETQVKSEDVLEVTKLYYRVWQILEALRGSDVVTKEVMQDSVYRMSSLEYFGTAHFFTMVWPDLYKATPEDIRARTKPDDWKIEPEKMQYLGYLLTGRKDAQDRGHNLLLKWMCISGEEADEDMARRGYHVYKSYFYYFPYVERLHRVLVEAHRNATPEKLFSWFLEMFNQLSKIGSPNLQAVRGHAFENTLKYRCAKNKKGLFIGAKPYLVEVDKICEATSVAELKKVIEKNVKSPNDNLWCELNVDAKQSFPGYNFANVQNVRGQLVVQLLQVTVSALRHEKKQILEVFNDVQSTLGNAEVKPYFIIPENTAGVKSVINLGPNVAADVACIRHLF